uniref:Uncharacterized protein n=1 Tax=Theileria annulata TaxID=5874 RepID=A0A3B0MN52_THEAN
MDFIDSSYFSNNTHSTTNSTHITHGTNTTPGKGSNSMPMECIAGKGAIGTIGASTVMENITSPNKFHIDDGISGYENIYNSIEIIDIPEIKSKFNQCNSSITVTRPTDSMDTIDSTFVPNSTSSSTNSIPRILSTHNLTTTKGAVGPSTVTDTVMDENYIVAITGNTNRNTKQFTINTGSTVIKDMDTVDMDTVDMDMFDSIDTVDSLNRVDSFDPVDTSSTGTISTTGMSMSNTISRVNSMSTISRSSSMSRISSMSNMIDGMKNMKKEMSKVVKTGFNKRVSSKHFFEIDSISRYGDRSNNSPKSNILTSTNSILTSSNSPEKVFLTKGTNTSKFNTLNTFSTNNTMGKGANSTAMECTMGKGANSMVIECTPGKRANSKDISSTKDISTSGIGSIGASTVTDVTENLKLIDPKNDIRRIPSFYDLEQVEIHCQNSLKSTESLKRVGSKDSFEYLLFGNSQEYISILPTTDTEVYNKFNSHLKLDRFLLFGFHFNKLLNSISWLASIQLSCKSFNTVTVSGTTATEGTEVTSIDTIDSTFVPNSTSSSTNSIPRILSTHNIPNITNSTKGTNTKVDPFGVSTNTKVDPFGVSTNTKVDPFGVGGGPDTVTDMESNIEMNFRRKFNTFQKSSSTPTFTNFNIH